MPLTDAHTVRSVSPCSVNRSSNIWICLANGFPTEWVQTEKNHYFYNFKKGINVELLGYNVVGAVIAGQPFGAKVSDEIKFNYVIDGSKELFGF